MHKYRLGCAAGSCLRSLPVRKTLPLLLLLTVTASVAQANLVGRWRFDGDFNDSTTNGNNGVAIDGVTIGAGISGGAASFDGDNDAVRIDGISALIGATYSLSFWEFSAGTTNTGYFLGSGTGSGFNHLFLRRVSGSGATELRGSSQGNTFTAQAVAREQWNHHLVVVDNSLSGTWYVNGVQTAITLGAGVGDLLTEALFVGNRLDGNRDFLGRIDDLQVYSTLLNGDHAALLFNNPGLALPEPSTGLLLGSGLLGMLMSRRRRTGATR